MTPPFPKSQQLGRPKTSKPRGRRVTASPKQWKLIVAAKDGPCRVCGSRRESFHHVVPRGNWRGSDTADNIVPLCGSGTTGCHGLIETRDPTAMRALVLSLTDAEYAHAVQHGGESFLSRRYGITYTKEEAQ